MIVVLEHPNYPGRPAHDSAVKKFFGLRREDKWPSGGLPSKRLPLNNGLFVQAFVISKEAAKREGRFQRCLCSCPTCSEVVPLGRLNQHWRVHA